MPTNSPNYDRAYRAARKALGRRVARGTDRAIEFVAWDGEGETVRHASGIASTALWDGAVRERTAQIVAEHETLFAHYWTALREVGGRITPGEYHGKMRGEFADIPRHLLRRPSGDGNLDSIADAAGVDEADALDFFSRHGYRMTPTRARAQARDELERERPRPGVHNYTLLANSRDGVVLRGDQLMSASIFDALLEGKARYPKAVHCFFGGSYDATMALKDLPRIEAERLWKAGQYPVRVLDRYAVLYRPRRSLYVARYGNPRWVDHRPNYVAKAQFWDVWGFFQGTFVEALEKYGFDPALVQRIAAMKDKRSTFSSDDRAAVEAYCVDECVYLETLMGKLATSLIEAGLRPRVWNGAGAVAATLLAREGVKQYIAEVPAILTTAVKRAYFGGRIELAKLGWVQGEVYVDDIASAYPWAATSLPDLRGRWVDCRFPSNAFALYRITFDFPVASPWYPLPYRTPRGTILFPHKGAGWYYEPEVAQAFAFAARFGGSVTVEAGYTIADDGTRPFAFIEPLFAKRKAWKQSGNGAEKAAKLGLNSLYGKTAQQLGGSDKKRPPFHSLTWAGYITSATRARLVEAALTDPTAVIAFATDGIATTRPLSLPHYADGLGQWESTIATDGVFAQAGVYWLREGGKWKAKYRGFDKEALRTPEAVLEAWCHGQRSIDLPCTRFVGLGSALCSPQCWDARGTWRTVPRTLDLTGRSAKRVGVVLDRAELASLPVQWNIDFDATGALSAAYRLAWEAPQVDGSPEGVVEEEWEAGTV